MYTIKLGKSKKLARLFIEQYNVGKKLGEQLRANHRSLLGGLIYYYSEELKSAQAYGKALKEGRSLPELRTNNSQLKEFLGTCRRTVQNLRERLVAANIITETVYHGSNSSYGIRLNPAILFLSIKGNSENQILKFQAPENPPAIAAHMQTLRHTVTSVTSLGTNKLIKLEGVDFQQKIDNQPTEGKEAVDKAGTDGGKENPIVEKQHGKHITATREPQEQQEPRQVTKETATNPEQSPPVALAPPQEAPDSIKEATKGMARIEQMKVERHVERLWTIILLNLYENDWLSEAEIQRGKGRIAEYFTYTKPKHYSKVAAEFTDRIMLVKKWIARGKAKGNEWKTPIPSAYFDIRKEYGFRKTKAWYKKHLEVRHEINEKTKLTKAVNAYVRSLEDGSKIAPAEAYRRIVQRLGKQSKRLVSLFHEQIAGLKNTNKIS